MYGEFITLDNVSCKGEKIYKNITPENVFYDDTKVCIAKGYITKKGKLVTLLINVLLRI